MEEYAYGMDSQVNSSFISKNFSFINEVAKGDSINNFTTNETLFLS